MGKSVKILKKRYNGITDPYDYVKEFKAHLDAFNVANVAKCKAFPIMMEGRAVNWFSSLSRGSIALFKNL